MNTLGAAKIPRDSTGTGCKWLIAAKISKIPKNPSDFFRPADAPDLQRERAFRGKRVSSPVLLSNSLRGSLVHHLHSRVKQVRHVMKPRKR